MQHNLICPDQLREFGTIVNDIPLLRIPPHERRPEQHSIIDAPSQLHIPLLYDKPISYFVCRKPTSIEINDKINYVNVQMTGDAQWTPYDEVANNDEYLIRESLMNDYQLLHTSNTDRHIQILQRYSTLDDPIPISVGLGDENNPAHFKHEDSTAKGDCISRGVVTTLGDVAWKLRSEHWNIPHKGR